MDRIWNQEFSITGPSTQHYNAQYTRNPISHKLSPKLLSGCCDFKLDLLPLCHHHIHRGVTVTYPQKWILISHRTASTGSNSSSVMSFLKPYLKKLYNRLVPTVYASENTGKFKENEEIRDEQPMPGEQPVEMTAEDILRNETGWDRLKEMYGRYEG